MNERDCRHGLPKNNCPRCEDEKYIAELEDALRWRKYPEKKPEIDGTYLIATEGFPIRLMAWDNTAQRWFCLPKGEIYYWLPIPPLEEK